MKRSYKRGRTVALLFVVAASHIPGAYGQTPTPASTTVAGCVSRAVQTGSLTAQPGVPPATPATAPVLANSNEPTGAFLLNAVTDPTRESVATSGTTTEERPVTFVLDGMAEEFERHVGHHVMVTGSVVVVEEGTPSAKTPVRHLRVTAIKMMAPACQKPTQKTPK